VADHTIHDDHPEGWLDMTGLLARSSNICAAKLALDIGPERLYPLLAQAGFGRRTGIGISGESPGILPPMQRWGPVETATIAFGQGVAVTPLQLAMAFCMLANGGVRVAPRLIQGRAYPDPAQVIPVHIAHAVMRMLTHAASPEGTGALAVPDGYHVAGKTGTAQKPDGHGGYAAGRFTSVFAGAVPADDPKLVIAVVVDEPQDDIYGGKVAAPVFRRIAQAALPYLGVSPHLPGREWRRTPVNAPVSDRTILISAGEDVIPSLYGLSLRETRRLAARSGYHLHVHGSGWVVRQKPVALSRLSAGAALEVWLDD